MSIQIIPFQSELLLQAAKLLARRYTNDRISWPQMPTRFEEPQVTQKSIEAILKRKHARGFAALETGRLVAYLIGDMVIDNVWGRSGWIRLAGCAYDLDGDVEIIRDLYAALGNQWVSYGVFSHFALIPVTDPALIQIWFSLSFGLEQTHALRDLADLNSSLPAISPTIEIRQAGPEDRQAVTEMSDVIWKTQVKAPVWGVMMPETVSEMKTGWADLVDDAGMTVWLALRDGNVVAMQGYWPADQTDDNLLIPEQCIHLGVAGTRTEERGQGIGTFLTQYGLTQARSAGYRFCEIDWRSTSPLSARFWPRQGFRPVVYRLVRRIDQRIVWADGRDKPASGA